MTGVACRDAWQRARVIESLAFKTRLENPHSHVLVAEFGNGVAAGMTLALDAVPAELAELETEIAESNGTIIRRYLPLATH